MVKEYWFCMVGPIDTTKIPNDNVPRSGVREAMWSLNIEDQYQISSGWGVSEAQAELIRNLFNSKEYEAARSNELVRD
jgi:hypothetical protein